MTSSQHVYEIRPRKDRRGFDLISDRLPLGILWFEGPDAFVDAVKYAKFSSASHAIIIHLFDESGAVIETHESDESRMQLGLYRKHGLREPRHFRY
jgi:hypothetical protein